VIGRRSRALLVALFVALPSTGAASPPARRALTIEEPAWKGAPRALLTPEYRESTARLQALARDHVEGLPLRVSSPQPCILRLERGDSAATFVDARRGFLHQVTWIDLRLGARLGAQAFGRNPGMGPAMLATCAWLEGKPGLAVSTEIIALPQDDEPVRRMVLAAEEHPRFCVANDVEPQEVAAPIRRLVRICGGDVTEIPVAAERATSSKEMLVLTWEGPLAERVGELARDGTEDAVLGPLARHPVAARIMLDYFRNSDRLLQRKLAPSLAGLLGGEAPSETLDEILEAETARRRASLGAETTAGDDARMQAVDDAARRLTGRPGIAAYLDAQSVVEDVVIAARRWCAVPSRAPAGGAVLRKVVERTIAGEPWNTSGAAMKGLVCDCQAASPELLARFKSWAFAVSSSGSPLPDHIEGRRVVEALRAGRCDDPAPRAATPNPDPLADWDRRDRAGLRAFLFMAESAK
jgi:hypothetical protein